MKSERDAENESGKSVRTAVTRRRALLGVSGVAATALAGCLGSGASKATIEVDLPCFESNSAKSVDQPLPAPVKGDPKSNVTVAAYKDYACSHCKHYVLNVVPQLQKHYIEPGKIRYEHYDFPFMKTESYTAANAARAAQARAGDEAFWVYAKQLFKHQQFLGPDLYALIAEKTCLGSEAVRTAAKKREYKPTVMDDRRRATKKGVNSTPTVFVNGKELSSHSFDAISSAIESAL